MPIIAVKLNHDANGRNEGIDTELATDKMLTLVNNTKRIKQSITLALITVRVQSLLSGIRSNQLGVSTRVGIAASQRAISDIVSLVAGWRPLKSLTTYLADMLSFISSLPLIGMIVGAEVNRLAEAIGGNIDWGVTDSASHGLPRFPLWATRLAVAIQRAISLVRSQVPRNGLTTSNAGYSSYFVAFRALHNLSISQSAAIVKPIGVMR